MKHIPSLLLTICLVGSTHIYAQGQFSQDSFSSQIDPLFSEWNNEATPGAAVGIVKNGELIFKKGYGMSNLDHAIPINPTSASSGKTISFVPPPFSSYVTESVP